MNIQMDECTTVGDQVPLIAFRIFIVYFVFVKSSTKFVFLIASVQKLGGTCS